MFAAVRILNFALRVAVLNQPELDGAPLVLGPSHGERPKALDCTPEASALGLRIGMSLRDVIATCPFAQVIATNPVREDGIAARIFTDLERLSPLVEADPTETACWYLDLTGLERLAGSPEEIARQILGVIPPALRPRVGIANGKFPARVAAGRAAPGSFLMIAPKSTTAALAHEPVASLPMPIELIQRFEQLGITTLGILAGLAPSAMAARFGPVGRRAWELANGRDNDAVAPRPVQDVIIEQIELPAPTASRDTLLLGLRLLVARASHHRAIQYRGARKVRIRAIYESGESWEKQVSMRDPARGDRLYELLRLRFQALELPQPVSDLAIELSELSKETARQDFLDGLRTAQIRPLIEAAQQLKSRYGASPLFHVVEVEPWSRIPERRHALMPYDP